MILQAFDEIVFLDFEFQAASGELPRPVCCVGIEGKSGKVYRCWLDGVPWPVEPPFAHGPSVLVVAYFASAELGCYRSLGWRYPHRVIDLFAEFRVTTNGLRTGRSLLDALQYFELTGITTEEKETFRRRILSGGPYNANEQQAVLDYCQCDVDATQRLFTRLIRPNTVLTGALVRGEYTKTVASAEYTGVPLDGPLYRSMVEHWRPLQAAIVDRVSGTVPVYEGLSFRIAKFESFLEGRGVLPTWPRTEGGKVALDDETFREQAALHPELEPLRQVRQMLGQMHRPGLHVGRDGRNRCMLSPFKTKTGRNAPSTTHFIFGAPSFMRGLIRPARGKALAYVDWSQQEFGIAAALAHDSRMQESYRSGDPYLAFAKLAGAVPADATKHTHPRERNLFKKTVLGVQYLIGAPRLACQLGVTLVEAGDLLEHHRKIFHKFWEWSDSVSDAGQMYGSISAAFGWRLHVTADTSLRTLRNFPMQSNGSEMLRLAAIFAHDAGVSIVAMVHDALLIESSADDIEHAVAQTQSAMRRASEIDLAGFQLRTDAQVIPYPNRFREERGELMWKWITEALLTVGEYTAASKSELGASHD